jgi:gliding motility-associated-like protein
VCDKGQVFVPNSFTPNGDGQNDVFYPRGVGINKIVSFRVFDRWGEMVFERTNITLNDEGNAWDGTYKGNKPRPDVYVYTIDAICESGEELFFKGDVTIIR